MESCVIGQCFVLYNTKTCPSPIRCCSTCHVSAFFARVQYFLCRWVASRLLWSYVLKTFFLTTTVTKVKRWKLWLLTHAPGKKACVVVTDLTGRLELINAPSLKKMHEKTRCFFGLDSRLHRKLRLPSRLLLLDGSVLCFKIGLKSFHFLFNLEKYFN